MHIISFARSPGALAAIAALTFSAAIAAQDDAPEKPVEDFSGMRNQELIVIFRDNGNRWIEEPCTFGVPLTRAMLDNAPGAEPLQRVELLAQIFCADVEKRYAEAVRLLRDLRQVAPEENFTGLTLYFLRRTEDVDGLIAELRDFGPDDFAELDAPEWFEIGRIAKKAGRRDEIEDLALEWWRAGKLKDVSADYRAAVASTAFDAAARKGDTEAAKDLLGEITSPPTYIRWLTRREYEPLWPEIGKRAGPNLTRIGDENVAKTLAEFEANPENRDLFSAYAYALHYNGQFEDAIELAGQWRKRQSEGAKIEEGDAWVLNIAAYAYDSLGQPEKADAVFDELAGYQPEEHPWVVNFVINRASRLIGQGRWKEGLEAAALARTVSVDYGSTYAKMIVARDHACGLAALGRLEEAAAELDFLRENKSSSMSLVSKALMCLDLRDEAAATLLDGLRNEDDRASAIDALETAEMDLFYTPSPALPDNRELLEEYPELSAELDKHFRPLPEEFIPRAALRRAEIKAQ